MTLNVGIAGFGVVGQQRAICVASNPDLTLDSVCDLRASVREAAKLKGLKAFETLDPLLERGIDVLFVCTSNDVTTRCTLKGLEAGCHLFVEKPPARTLKEFEPIVRWSRDNPKQRISFGFNHRFHDSVRQAKEIIDKKELGHPLNFRAIYGKSQLITFGQSDWRTKREIAGGGILLDQGIHMLDLLRYFFGEFEVRSSYVSNAFWGYDVEDNVFALLSARGSELTGLLHSSATQWSHKFSLAISFERGLLELEGILSSSKSYGAEKIRIFRRPTSSETDLPDWTVAEYERDDSWQREVDLFVRAIKDPGLESTNGVTDAYESLSLVQQIYRSDLAWRRKFDLDNWI